VRFLSRVLVGADIVDEAMGYDPVDEQAGNVGARALIEFGATVGYSVDDPRANGRAPFGVRPLCHRGQVAPIGLDANARCVHGWRPGRAEVVLA